MSVFSFYSYCFCKDKKLLKTVTSKIPPKCTSSFVECRWGMGKESKEVFTQGMVGKDYSRVPTHCLLSETLLEGYLKLNLKIKESLHSSYFVHLPIVTKELICSSFLTI